MKLGDRLGFCLQSLRSQPARTLLIALAMAIGTAGVVVPAGGGGGGGTVGVAGTTGTPSGPA